MSDADGYSVGKSDVGGWSHCSDDGECDFDGDNDGDGDMVMVMLKMPVTNWSTFSHQGKKDNQRHGKGFFGLFKQTFAALTSSLGMMANNCNN